MLTIGKLGLTRGRLEYYDAQVAAGAEDYYAGRGESPGRWRGAGLQTLGIGGGERVERAGFMSIMQGRHPVDGSALRAVGARSTVAGLDLTFSAPKSVSVLFAIADETVSRAALAAHEHAVDAALAYLEREACWTRRGRNGVDRLRGDGFVAASYRHRMSRSGDPQLHTHVVVANMTRAEGRYTALDAHVIYEHKSAGGAVYRAALRAELRDRLPWVSWRSSGRGLFEIDGIPEEVLRHFSQRRVEIEERALELVGTDGGELSRDRMQGIALATRRAKDYGIQSGTWTDESRARASEHGFGTTELQELTTHQPTTADATDLAAVASHLSGPAGLTERHNTFARRHALAELAGAFEQGTSIGELERATDNYLTSPGVVTISDTDAASKYTTEDLLAYEAALIDSAVSRRTDRCGVLPSSEVNATITDRDTALNDDQLAAIRTITSRGRGVDAVEALAGTGKTTMIGALANCYRQAGWQVRGVAPTGRAARELRDIAHIPATTVHSLLLELERADGLQPRTLLVLDEAAMTPTRHAAMLLVHAAHAGAKVVAIGDSGQLGPVEAGGWLGALNREVNGPALRTVMRQHDRGEQLALEALHDGDPDAYIDHKQPNISMHESEIDAVLELSARWHAAQHQHGMNGSVMIARDNLTRHRLNRAARTRLKQEGVLDGAGILIGGREYAPGDRVVTRRNSRNLDIDNGTLATVVGIDDDGGAITIEGDDRRLRTLDAVYVAEHLEHAYALTGHAAQGGTFAWVGVIGRPEEFSREWAYTALSRASTHTEIHVVNEQPERFHERDEYAPPEPQRDLARAEIALSRALVRADTERLGSQQLIPTGALSGADLLRRSANNRSTNALRR